MPKCGHSYCCLTPGADFYLHSDTPRTKLGLPKCFGRTLMRQQTVRNLLANMGRILACLLLATLMSGCSGGTVARPKPEWTPTKIPLELLPRRGGAAEGPPPSPHARNTPAQSA